jgi:hypothetical protein
LACEICALSITLSKFSRAAPFYLPEKAGEIRCIAEPELVSNLGDVEVGMRQQTLRFKNQSPSKMFREVSCGFLANEMIKPAPGNSQ